MFFEKREGNHDFCEWRSWCGEIVFLQFGQRIHRDRNLLGQHFDCGKKAVGILPAKCFWWSSAHLSGYFYMPRYAKVILEGKEQYEFRKSRPKDGVDRIIFYALSPQRSIYCVTKPDMLTFNEAIYFNALVLLRQKWIKSTRALIFWFLCFRGENILDKWRLADE